MKCKVCGREVELRIGWRAVTFRCTACGKEFPISAYIDQIDEGMWEKISRRPCNRAW